MASVYRDFCKRWFYCIPILSVCNELQKQSVLKKGSVVLVYPIFGCDIIEEQFDKSFWGQLFYKVEKIIIFLVKTHSFCPKYFIICEIFSLELFHAHFLHRLFFYVPLLIFCWLKSYFFFVFFFIALFSLQFQAHKQQY